MPLSVTDFGVYLGKWAENYAGQFKLYYPLKGGWEAWAQASVAAFIIEGDSTVDILREQLIFYGQQKVDWLLNDNDQSVINKVAIELKCQSFENKDGFTGGLESDIAKLAQANLKVNYKGCKTAVVGIAFTQDAADWMGNHHFDNQFQSGDVAIGMSVLN